MNLAAVQKILAPRGLPQLKKKANIFRKQLNQAVKKCCNEQISTKARCVLFLGAVR